MTNETTEYDADEVNEHDVTVKVRLATYDTAMETVAFGRRLAAMLAADIESERDYVFKANPQVEVKWVNSERAAAIRARSEK